MPTVQKSLNLRTAGRGTIDLTTQVAAVVSDSGIKQGLCNVFLQHTSASLILWEHRHAPHARSVMVTVIG